MKTGHEGYVECGEEVIRRCKYKPHFLRTDLTASHLSKPRADVEAAPRVLSTEHPRGTPCGVVIHYYIKQTGDFRSRYTCVLRVFPIGPHLDGNLNLKRDIMRVWAQSLREAFSSVTAMR